MRSTTARAASIILVAAVQAVQAVVTAASDECTRLEAELRLSRAGAGHLDELQVRWDNEAHNVSIYWDSAPSRAAAAMLLVLLRYWFGYRHLHLTRQPVDYCQFDSNQTVAAVPAVGMWTSSPRAQCGSLESWPLLGYGATRVRLKLHVRLSSRARASPRCLHPHHQHNHTAWPFLLHRDRLRDCLFLGNDSDARAVVYGVCGKDEDEGHCHHSVKQFGERARAWSLLVDVVSEPVHRLHLMDLIQADNQSFLFIDYDIWEDYPLVYNVQPPPCLPHDARCSDPGLLDHTTGVRYAHYKLQHYAPTIANVVKLFEPETKHMRDLLNLEASYPKRTLEETTCSWARNHSEAFVRWANYSRPTYIMMVVSCDDSWEVDYDAFNQSNHIVFNELDAENNGFYIDLKWFRIDCYNANEFSDLIVERSGWISWYRTLGVVARGEGAAAVACGERSMHLRSRDQLPMVLYDVAPTCALGPTEHQSAPEPSMTTRAPVWAAGGTVPQLAAGLRRLLADCGWRRLAVLTDATRLAADLTAELAAGGELVLHRTPLSVDTASESLRELKARNARVVLVNAGPAAAAAVLRVALRLGMTPGRGYAWIVREWSGRSAEEVAAANVTRGAMKHYTVSLWSRSGRDVPWTRDSNATSRPRRQMVQALGEGEETTWSLRAAPWLDAMLTLGYGFSRFFREHPQYRSDVHSEDAVRYFTKSLNENPIKGFSVKELRYNAPENQTVYVDEWCGDKRTRLAEWRVRSGVAYDVTGPGPGSGPGPGPGVYPPRDLPPDGHGRCVARYGDPFDPVCLDWIWISTLVLLPVLCVGLWAVREMNRKRAARRFKEHELARHGSNVTKLLSLVVNRDELEIREELGFGKSGRVNLAILRRSGGPRAVAAKALREGAAPTEESEFLREACTLASLEHDHVVRLVGVCVVAGPTLVLMEHAFFGDLLRYLRARRHLAEGAGGHPDAPDPEAEHVSPEALTRLAREAASALGYLALRGVVHCDVRAANCLVDARRSLKLADFGMARQTQAAEARAGLAEYACRRRAMFPVLWMAPESLTRGVFSAATDVWALGVLVFELVTLGARPYGAWSPLRVLHFVHDGGRPSLPLDASPQTRGLARACWRRTGDERPSAAAVVAYLAERPRALSPALHLDPAEPTLTTDPMDSDSGFGETPSPGPEAAAHEADFGTYALEPVRPRPRPRPRPRSSPNILHDITQPPFPYSSPVVSTHTHTPKV